LKVFTAGWVTGFVAVSLQPWRPETTSRLSQFHRPFHLAAFAITALLLWRFLALAGSALLVPRILAARVWITALFATIILGACLELLQHLIYRNPMEWWDVRDDALGAIAAILLGRAVRATAFSPKAT